MIFPGAGGVGCGWVGVGRDKWYNLGGWGWNLFERKKGKKKLPHTLTPNSPQLKPHSHHHELPIWDMADNPRPSLPFSATSPISFQYQPIHTPRLLFLFPTSQLSTLTFIPNIPAWTITRENHTDQERVVTFFKATGHW